MANTKPELRSKADKRVIEYVSTSSLTPYARNSRTHSPQQVKQIAASIKEFGFTNPVLIDEANGIIAGHGRVMAAEHLQLTEVPCIRLEYLTETQKKAYVIADNKLALNAGWDEEMLNIELTDLHDDGFDVGMIGFEADELSDLMGYNDKEIVEDEVPETPAEPITKPGDLWLLGDHRLLCGDSTKAEDVGRLMAGGQADIILTDPPYGVAYQTALSTHEAAARNRRKDGKEVVNDSLGWDGTRGLVADAFKNASLKPGGAFYVFCPPGDLQAAFWLGLQDAGYNARHQIVWVKDRFVMGRCDYHYRHEVCLYGWAEGAGHFFIDDRTQDSVWECKRPSASKEHPTMKPVELFARCLTNSSKQAWLVYEPFCGSGTTLIAAEQLGRKCYGMEISPAYCDVIVKRWETLTGKKAVLENA